VFYVDLRKSEVSGSPLYTEALNLKLKTLLKLATEGVTKLQLQCCDDRTARHFKIKYENMNHEKELFTEP